MKVKICGITNLEDAHAAVNVGADALGFIFTQLSPRYVTPAAAREIIQTLPPFITSVGVVVNKRREEVQDIVAISGVRCLQFHGDENALDLVGYAVPVYKAFRVRAGFDVNVLERFPSRTFLLDSFSEGMNGGTGKTFDWRIAVDAKRFGRVILSGGLTPQNVCEAVRAVQPYAIDVSSGVESAPGKKDKHQLNELFSALHTMKEFAC
jgi:phosphoribosylanthranilate isomerase